MTSHQQRYSQGYIMIVALVFLSIFIVLASAAVNTSASYIKVERNVIASTQALHLAEAAVDKAISELNSNSSYDGEVDTSFGPGTFTTSVLTVDSSTKTVLVTASVPNSTNPIATKTVKVNVTIGNAVISFRYGVQGGIGGFNLSGGSSINGSVYSNGPVVAISASVSGSIIAANPPSLTADQVNESPTPISSCTTSNCITYANSNATEDFAQSFKISAAIPLNDIQFYIKKVGTPGNATVRIVTDNSGSPSNTTLMSGTLLSASVSTNFSWVSVTLPTTPVLDPSLTYWMVIDGSQNSSRYYILGANTSYTNGTAKIGKYGGTWNDTTPSGRDGYFRIYLGGGYSSIGGAGYPSGVMVGTAGQDDAWAHTIQGASATGKLYCMTGSHNNQSCDTSKGDPPSQAMPLSDTQIDEWKDDALLGGTSTGNVTVGWAGATLGPKKIVGDLTVNGGGTLTLTGTLWVTGNVTVTSGGKIKLASSYGTNSGALVTDGYVTLTGGASFAGSGTTGSYPFLITTSACPVAPNCGGNDAIYLSGGTGTVALIAQEGNVRIGGGSTVKQVTAKQLIMDGGSQLTYDSGLISENFMSGPGGSWNYVPGTYVIVN